jgi:hypothetical protein
MPIVGNDNTHAVNLAVDNIVEPTLLTEKKDKPVSRKMFLLIPHLALHGFVEQFGHPPQLFAAFLRNTV